MILANTLLDGKATDITVENGTIVAVNPHSPCEADYDAHGLSVFPGLCNMHSHAPMTLFRGLGDDQPLDVWLNRYIWPAEKKLTEQRVYAGTLQACREMLSSGTTFFNDMYFHLPAMAKAVCESGIRARLGLNVFGDADELDSDETLQLLSHPSPLITFSIAPHSVYTVTSKGLLRSARTCKSLGLKMHIHMSETSKEIDDCIKNHGCRPWQLLHRLGILDMLGHDIVAAHCLYLSQDEIKLIGHYGITCVHCPNSNLKLGSGYRFPMLELLEAGAHVALGTDGSASSNNLDMLEVMKTSALLQKGWRNDPTVVPASLSLKMASCGHSISIGQSADLFLAPVKNLSDLVYATHGESVKLTMVNGKIVYNSL